MLATPIRTTSSAIHEHQADIFGFNASREPDGICAKPRCLLSEYRKMEPTPFEEWFFYDHPSGYTRIHMAMEWKAHRNGGWPLIRWAPGGPPPGWRPDFVRDAAQAANRLRRNARRNAARLRRNRHPPHRQIDPSAFRQQARRAGQDAVDAVIGAPARRRRACTHRLKRGARCALDRSAAGRRCGRAPCRRARSKAPARPTLLRRYRRAGPCARRLRRG